MLIEIVLFKIPSSSIFFSAFLGSVFFVSSCLIFAFGSGVVAIGGGVTLSFSIFFSCSLWSSSSSFLIGSSSVCNCCYFIVCLVKVIPFFSSLRIALMIEQQIQPKNHLFLLFLAFWMMSHLEIRPNPRHQYQKHLFN